MAKTSHSYYSAVNHVKLTFGVFIHSFIIFFLVYSLAVVGLIYLFYPTDAHRLNLYFIYAYNDFWTDQYGSMMTNLENGIFWFWKVYRRVFLINLYLWLLLPAIIYSLKYFKGKSNFIRGTELQDINTIKSKIGSEPTRLPIGKLKLPIANETRHFFVGGRPGVGKTNLFNSWISEIAKDKQKAIIYDSKMDYIVKFYDSETDLIANPFDKRCIRWTVLNDATTIMDLLAIAQSIIPSAPEGSEPVWYDAPRDILFGIFLYCYINNKKTNKDIWETINFDTTKLLNIMKFTPGAEVAVKALDSHKETLGSIMLMLMKYAKIFDFLQHLDGDFSIRDWVRSDQKNFIFLPNYADSKIAIQPFFSLFVETVGRAILALEEDKDRRIYLFLDEFGTIQKMEMIVDLLTQSRSKGGAIFLGTQEVVRIDSIYGEKLREAILNACNNSIVFAMGDTTDANIFSEKLGKVEFWEQQENLSLGQSTDRVNVSQQKRLEIVVLPSEIMKLEDLTAYVSLANYGLTFVEFEYKSLPDNAEGFIMHDYYSLDNRQVKPLHEAPAAEDNTGTPKPPQLNSPQTPILADI